MKLKHILIDEERLTKVGIDAIKLTLKDIKSAYLKQCADEGYVVDDDDVEVVLMGHDFDRTLVYLHGLSLVSIIDSRLEVTTLTFVGVHLAPFEIRVEFIEVDDQLLDTIHDFNKKWSVKLDGIKVLTKQFMEDRNVHI